MAIAFNPGWWLFLSPLPNLGFNQGGLCNHSTGRHLPGPGWNLKLWVWKVFLMGLCILLLEPHVSGSHKSPVQTSGMAAERPRRGLNGEAEEEPVYSTISRGHSWGVCRAWKSFVNQWNSLFSPSVWVALLMWDRLKCLHIWHDYAGIKLFTPDGMYQAVQCFLGNKVNCFGEKYNKETSRKQLLVMHSENTWVEECHNDIFLSYFSLEICEHIMHL